MRDCGEGCEQDGRQEQQHASARARAAEVVGKHCWCNPDAIWTEAKSTRSARAEQEAGAQVDGFEFGHTAETAVHVVTTVQSEVC